MTGRLLRTAAGLLLALLLAGCAVIGPQGKPKLVVLLVVDGLPQRQVTGYRDQLAPDGLARFLDRGRWFSEAHYGHAFTVTAAGHASLLTGAYAHRSGIIGNEWVDVNSGATVYCTSDVTARYIGHRTDPLDGTSPRNLQAEALGDVLRAGNPRSKVLAISGKDRGAILPAGQRGTAYMYMDESGQFASSTYYMQQHPAWVDAFHAARPADRHFKAEWKPLLPDAAYARSVPDGQPWFGVRGGKLPMMMGAPADTAPGPAFYASLLPSPFGDALALDFARAAIAGEQLGADDAPDILVVSLSGHDYVNHRWSAESRLSHDHLLQLDRLLEAFFRDLDAKVGRDNYVAVLTADHGFTPAPEYSQSQGRAAGRVASGPMLARVNAALEQQYRVPKLVRTVSASALLLDRQLLAQHRLDLDQVAEAARAALAADPMVVAAYTRRELTSRSRAGAPFFDAMARSWNQERSADVQYAIQPFHIFGSSVATHGSPHAYDTHVPLMFWGPRWVRPAAVAARAEPVDIAPTLAQILGIPAPGQSEGRVLPLR